MGKTIILINKQQLEWVEVKKQIEGKTFDDIFHFAKQFKGLDFEYCTPSKFISDIVNTAKVNKYWVAQINLKNT